MTNNVSVFDTTDYLPAITNPNEGALQIEGITSDMAERATAIQLIKPDNALLA